MSHDYSIGSATDLNAANRQTCMRIESAAMQAPHTAGLSRMTALEATSDMVIGYLTKANNESLKLVRHLAGNKIAEQLVLLRPTALEVRQ